MRSIALAALATLLAGTLAAQGQTWIVDAAGGPGSHFTNLPPALQVAQDGDTILVRSGTYDGGAVTTAVAIVADAGAAVSVRMGVGFFASALEVSGLPAGKTVVLEGLGLAPSTAPPLSGAFVQLAGCAGRVHCDRLDADLMAPGSNLSYTGLSVQGCAHVSVHDCRLRNGLPLAVSSSTALVTDSLLNGQNAFTGFGSLSRSSPAISASSSAVTVARSRLEGGDGNFPLSVVLDPSPAITASGGTLTVAGGAEAHVQAGVSNGPVMTPTPAIGGAGTAVTVDPRVTLTPSNGAPPIAAGHTAAIQRVPALAADCGPPGGALVLDLLASAGDLTEIYLGLPFGPVPSPIPGSGEIWIDFSLVINLGRAIVPPSETIQLTLPLPPIASLRGVPITAQALTASAAAGFRFSTPVTPVLN